jgi:hypothetical protein
VRPGRGLSWRPAKPWSRYRSAHLRTCRTLKPHRSAVSFKVWPWSRSRRIRPRRAKPAGPVVARCQRSISARSAGVRTMVREDLRPRMATPRNRGAGRGSIALWPSGSPGSHPSVNSEPYLCGVVLRNPRKSPPRLVRGQNSRPRRLRWAGPTYWWRLQKSASPQARDSLLSSRVSRRSGRCFRPTPSAAQHLPWLSMSPPEPGH